MAEMIKNRLIQEVLERMLESGEFDRAVDAVAAGETDPYTACDDLLLPKLNALK
jgi:LAO/AO transport system kinase